MAPSVGTELSSLLVPGGADASGRRGAAAPATTTAGADFATLMQVAGGELPAVAAAVPGAVPPAAPDAKATTPQPPARRAAMATTVLPWDMMAAAAEETGLLAGQFQQAMRAGVPMAAPVGGGENPPTPSAEADVPLLPPEAQPLVADLPAQALPPPVAQAPALVPPAPLAPPFDSMAQLVALPMPAAAATGGIASLPQVLPQHPGEAPDTLQDPAVPAVAGMAAPANPVAPQVQGAAPASTPPAGVAAAESPAAPAFASTSTPAIAQPVSGAPAALAMAALPLAAPGEAAVAAQPSTVPRPAEARRPATVAAVPAAGATTTAAAPAQETLLAQAVRPVEAPAQAPAEPDLEPEAAAQPGLALAGKVELPEERRFAPATVVANPPAEQATAPLAAPATPLPAEAAWRPEVVRPLAAAMATAAAPAPAPRPHPAADAAQQVAMQAASAAADGVETISVDLRPPELGRVELRLTFQDGTVQISMAAERAETFEAFRNDRAQLEQQMQQAGLQLGGGGLDLQHGRLPREAPEEARRHAVTPDAGTGDDAVDAAAAPRPRSDSLIDLIA